MKHSLFAAAATLAAILAIAPPVRATTTGHLYVHPRSGLLERFTLTDGLPASKPDLVYSGIDGLITTSADGTLYGLHRGYTVEVFPRGSVNPVRHIEIPQLQHCPGLVPIVNALAADSHGLLYVSLTGDYSGERVHGSPVRPMLHDGFTCNGYMVYGRDARGHAKPLFADDMGIYALPSMSVDGNENMYILRATVAIQRYTSPVRQPTLAGTFSLGYLQWQVLNDASNNAIMLYYVRSQNALNIAVFPPDSNGQGPPANDFVPEFPTTEIAVREPYIYACDSSSPAVDIYNEFGTGTQMPIAELQLNTECDQITAGR